MSYGGLPRVWTGESPLFLIAGGSGIVPLMAMLRHRAAMNVPPPARLLYSTRTFADIIYRAELERLAAVDNGLTVIHTLTRQHPPGWSGGTRRIDRAMLSYLVPPQSTRPHIFICGPTRLVETAAQSLVELGQEPGRIKTECFQSSGGLQ